MVIDETSVRDRLRPYLPRLTLEWLATDPADRHRTVDGSVVFVDISGFTKLSEKLARFGRVGAEEMADSINQCFAELLAIAYDGNGSLLKFGGDALLLLFTGDESDHVVHAARAAHGMRARLRTVGKLVTTGGKVNLRMSVGVHTGRFDFFLVGDSHRELLVTGPATTEVVHMEGTAEAGEIVISPAVASCLPARCVGVAKGPGYFLRSAPLGESYVAPWVLPDAVGDDLLRASVSAATREHLMEATGEPEHRQVTVAFIHFDGTDEMIDREGPERTADELHRLVSDTQAAADEYGVCFLSSDADADGGKLILTAGAPRAMGDDEERMLLALRRIVVAERRIQIRIGVNFGGVFAGDVGPYYRRTYTVMGDTVNLAARLMAKAPSGEIYATGPVLDRSATRFERTELEPFMVKGKAQPVRAWSVGSPIGSRARERHAQTFDLVGRGEELGVLHEALAEARAGNVRLVDIVGESGIGKSRLAEALRSDADDLRVVGATSEAYTMSSPYVAWREVLRDLLDLGWEDPSDVVVDRLQNVVREAAPALAPWLPLLARAADAEMELTPEVRDLAPEFQRPRLHDAVIGLLHATVTSATLFDFEDAHLMDEPSGELLAALATRGIDDRPWLFIARRREAPSGFSPPDTQTVRRITLGALDGRSAAALARAATEEAPLPPHVVHLAVERSSGNPQLLLDLLDAAASGEGVLPDSVEAAATVRIDNLAPGDRQLLRRASVLGVSFHHRFLDEVLGEDLPVPDELTWERLSEFFEQEEDGFIRFRRAVVRDAAYAGLPFRVRRRLHGALAHRMEKDYADPRDAAGILSLHYFVAGEHEKAWEYAIVAARSARDAYANVEAARLYRRSIEAARKAQVSTTRIGEAYRELGDVLRRAGMFGDAKQAYREARLFYTGDPIVQARLLDLIATTEQDQGRYPLALRWWSKARGILGEQEGVDAWAVAAKIDASYAGALANQGRTRETLRIAMRAISTAEAAGAKDTVGLGEIVVGGALLYAGMPEADQHLVRALQVFEETGDLASQAMALLNLGASAYLGGRWSEALDFYNRATSIYDRIGDVGASAQAKTNAAEVLSGQGRFAEAESLLRDMLHVWRSLNDSYQLGFCLGQLGRVVARTGRIDEGRDHLRHARDAYAAAGAGLFALEVDAGEAECLLCMGDMEAALVLSEAATAKVTASGELSFLLPPLHRVRGHALACLGRIDEAEAALQQSVVSAREIGADHELMVSLPALARLARRSGRDGSEMQAEAEAIMERLGVLAVPALPMPKLAVGV